MDVTQAKKIYVRANECKSGQTKDMLGSCKITVTDVNYLRLDNLFVISINIFLSESPWARKKLRYYKLILSLFSRAVCRFNDLEATWKDLFFTQVYVYF